MWCIDCEKLEVVKTDSGRWKRQCKDNLGATRGYFEFCKGYVDNRVFI